ncbi:hypothetical protein N657DRAFT_649843, partial [Parathielavia appendiculata]
MKQLAALPTHHVFLSSFTNPLLPPSSGAPSLGGWGAVPSRARPLANPHRDFASTLNAPRRGCNPAPARRGFVAEPVGSGKVRVTLGDEPEFVVDPHGLFKVKPGV